jgi:hypothetical protein
MATNTTNRKFFNRALFEARISSIVTKKYFNGFSNGVISHILKCYIDNKENLNKWKLIAVVLNIL